MMPGWCCSGVMLQSDRFCRFLNTSVRRRLTCASNFDGMPYAVSSMMRPGSWLACGIGSGAARAAPAAANAPPVSAADLRMKSLRLDLLGMGPPPSGESSMRPASLQRQDAPFQEEALCVAVLQVDSPAVGQLAERYRDASRSGVYRVTDAAVPRAAAQEAGSGSQVLVIEGFDSLAAEDFQVIAA